MNEFDLIKEYFVPLAGPEGLGLKDDAAHFSAPAGFDIVLTKDTMVEGVHFPDGVYGPEVAERLLRVNLSDLAAKAARPRGYLLSVAWPRHLETKNLSGFSKGLKTAQDEFDITLWGGDTVSTRGPAVFTATLIGVCPTGLSSQRIGAKPKDDIWLSGYLGKGYLGLAAIEGRLNNDKYQEGFYKPPPRLALKNILRTYAGAAIDISDGLVADLGHLAASSQVSAMIEISHLWFPKPVATLLQKDTHLMREFLTHGDDYEVLFTAHPDYREKIESMAGELDFKLTRIGQCGSEQGVTIFNRGEPLEFQSRGYNHFA